MVVMALVAEAAHVLVAHARARKHVARVVGGLRGHEADLSVNAIEYVII